MNCKNIHVVYFSPTHTSAKIVHAVAEGMGAVSYAESDLTYEKPAEIESIEGELTLVAVPVYGGRVPDVALERLQMLQGKQTPVVPIVVYGNRDYDDALLELADVLKSQGFVPVAAGAFVGEHSFSSKEFPIAAGRPDKADHDAAFLFGQHIVEKIHALKDWDAMEPLAVKGHFPYKEKKPAQPAAPLTDLGLCTQCEHCIAICPTEAVSVVDGEIYSDPLKCIKCCACVKECPEGARTFPNPFAAYLYQNFSARKEPELFL